MSQDVVPVNPMMPFLSLSIRKVCIIGIVSATITKSSIPIPLPPKSKIHQKSEKHIFTLIVTPVNKEKYVTVSSTGSYGAETSYKTPSTTGTTIKPVWHLPANAYVTKVIAYNGYKEGTSRFSVYGIYGSTTTELRSAQDIPRYSGSDGTKTYTFTDTNNNGLTAVEVHLVHTGSTAGGAGRVHARIYYKTREATSTSSWNPI